MIETGIVLDQIDNGLARISAQLAACDLIMEEIDQAARDPEQLAFEERNGNWHNMRTKGQITDERGRTA